MKKGPYMVMYDRTNTERLSALEFGMIRPGETSREIEIWLWNKKYFDDAPMATDIRVSVLPANSFSEGIIEGKYVEVRSDGVMDPDGMGIIDDAESEFSGIGGELTEPGAYHSIGDIPTNCARRLVFRVNPPGETVLSGFPRFLLQIGYFSEEVKWLYMSDE
ncbi:MAG: hypothetical protein NTY09_07630 [bacterium]|nr:hypothetical protein [bacterium]